MEYRNLELTLVSAKGLKKKSSFTGKLDVYAVASISDTVGNTQKVKTHVAKEGGSDPTWNFPMKFTVNESALQQNRLTLVIKIKGVGMFYDKNVGEAHVPVKEIFDGKSNVESVVSYQVKRMSGTPQGFVSFSYKFGEKFEQAVTAYPAQPYVVEHGRRYLSQPGGYPQQAYVGYPPPGYPQQAPVGYPPAGYPQQQPTYASYPPPPPPLQPAQRSRLGGGFGTGLLGGALGGLLIGDMMSHGGGGCGGGCGGGGCGGGCGGGGCGG